ncbi:MAG TPA: hypothetical protein VFG69_06850, partial [Nannocystaceae bacterium]|nr:hypothetical protein [Nannocystaceae bacterium]
WSAIAPARGVALRDLDDDGVLEVLARPSDAPALAVYVRDRGEYAPAHTTDLRDHADDLLETGRLDGDDVVDLASYAVGGRSVELWLGDRDLGWSPTTPIELDAAVRQLVLADVDDDGAADLIAGTFDEGTITVVRAQP